MGKSILSIHVSSFLCRVIITSEAKGTVKVKMHGKKMPTLTDLSLAGWGVSPRAPLNK